MTYREELLLGDSKQPLETFFILKSLFILFHFEGEDGRQLPDLLLVHGENLLPPGFSWSQPCGRVVIPSTGLGATTAG